MFLCIVKIPDDKDEAKERFTIFTIGDNLDFYLCVCRLLLIAILCFDYRSLITNLGIGHKFSIIILQYLSSKSGIRIRKLFREKHLPGKHVTASYL